MIKKTSGILICVIKVQWNCVSSIFQIILQNTIMRKYFLLPLIFNVVLNVHAQTKRPLSPADVYRMQDLTAPQVSPDGNWVAYVLTSVDSAKDKHDDNIWMISWDGKQNIQLTNSKSDESSPKFSPDGKYISFLSSRKSADDKDDKDELSQLWLLDRRGGEGKKITDVKGDIEDYLWSPDETKVLLVIKDQDFSDTASSEVRKPYAMDRYHFKQDYIGYLDRRATHFYLLDIISKEIDTLTTGVYNETEPAFNNDGTQIVFTSNRTEDPDKNENTDIYIMDAKPGAAMKKLTTWPGADHDAAFSPDGNAIAYLQSSSNEKFTMYGQNILAVISKDGGVPRLLSKEADRPITAMRWSKDGYYIACLMEDDRQSNIITYNVRTGNTTKLTTGDRATFGLELNPATGAWVALMSEPHLPFELFTVENGNTKRLTYTQDSFLAPLLLPTVEGFKSKSKDGTIVSGILYKPANAEAGKKLPLVLYVHGGPVAQDDYQFDMTAQIIASAGYAVAQVNYRGSSGRGVDFTKAIYADWGNKEVMDLVGAADYLIAQGIADETRMGIGGWSYGGILNCKALPAPLHPALKRVSVAIV